MNFLAAAGRRLLWMLFRKSAPGLFFFLILMLAVLILFFFIYSLLFLIPKYIAQDASAEVSGLSGKVVAIFNTGRRDDWKLADDLRLYEKYMDLDRNWLSQFLDQDTLDGSRIQYVAGNAADENATVKGVWGRFYDRDSWIPAERAQAGQHSVGWALLAAVDRVAGDGVITGLPGRRPEPEKNFRKLEPELKWQNFELYYQCRWTEKSGGGGGSAKSFSKVYRHSVRLLAEAHSYGAEKISYRWEAGRHYYSDPHTGFSEEAVYPVFNGSTQQGPYFKKLRGLLGENGLVRDSDLELVIHLAMNYDEEFKYNVGLVSGNLTDLFINTEETDYRQSGQPGKFLWPAGEHTTITSGFGWRIHPVLGGLRFHRGIDIALPAGTPVLSAWDGRVILAGWVEGYGNTVMIDHGRYRTLYAHLMSCDVDPGQEVRRGDRVGRAGSTGLSTGDHLHFEVRSGAGRTEFHDPLALYHGLAGGEGFKK